MPFQLLYLRELPKYENIRAAAKRYPNIDAGAVASYLGLLRVASDVGAEVEEYLDGHDISHGRFTVMMILNRTPEEGMCPAELADKSGVTRATMTGLLDGLERDGLVSRQGHIADRRMLTVSLTAKGKEFLAKVLPAYFSEIAGLMGPLSEKEKHQLSELLGKLCVHVTGLRDAKRAARGKK